VAHVYSCNEAILRIKHDGGVEHQTQNSVSGGTESCGRWPTVEAVNEKISRFEEIQM
jgi:hypothetical protein